MTAPQQPASRLIVALDVPTHDEALRLVDTLDNVSFFKVGWELALVGNLYEFLERLHERRRDQGGVFVDLKIAGDIGRTISSIIRPASALGVRFMTLTAVAEPATTKHTLEAGRQAGEGRWPQFVMVPLLSSIARPLGSPLDTDQYIVKTGRDLLALGCEGLVVSGTAIQACRSELGDTIIVSPGIRPRWADVDRDDQVRTTTPGEAISMGADYLVVGRPVVQNDDPFTAAQRIIEEMEESQ